MKILYLVHQFFPMNYTGTEKFLLNLSTTMQKWGNTVKVVTYSFYPDSFYDRVVGNVMLKDFSYKGIPITAIKYKRAGWDLGYALESAELTSIADEIFRKEKPDLVHVAHPMRMGEFIKTAIKQNIPYMVTLTDFWLMCPKAILLTTKGMLCAGPAKGTACQSDCPEYQYDSIVQRLGMSENVFKNARKIVAPSRFLGSLFKKEFPYLEPRFISYGIDYSRIRMNKLKYDNGHTLTFCYAGQLNYHKGTHTLIEAFTKTKGEHIKLKLYGSGPDDVVQKFKEMAGNDERIEFCGVFSEHQVGEVFGNVDCVIVPSNWHENNTIVMNEALACHVPVIVSDAGGMIEKVKDGLNGYIFRMGDAGHLQQSLQKIVDSPALLNSLKKNMNSYMMTTVEQEAFSYLEEYRRIVSQ
jgi:glycosyltransferase involved in cell wall biosynthesis